MCRVELPIRRLVGVYAKNAVYFTLAAKRKVMDKNYILSEIRRTAEANGGIPLGRQKFFEATGIKETDWSGKYWVRWGIAVKEAGYTPHEMQAAFSDEYLLGKYANAFREYGHPPTVAELKIKARNDPDFPSHNTFCRFGSK